MKKRLSFNHFAFLTAVMLILAACPPPDGADLEAVNNGNGNGGIEYETVKEIVFDDLSVFTETTNPPANGVINDWQRGGESGPVVELSSEKNHGSAEAGKSLKWSGRTFFYQRIKIDKIFSAADVGRMFNISLWIYTDTPTTIQLGTYRVSGAGVGEGTTAAETKIIEIITGWNELVWDGCEHTDSTVTQLAIEQPNVAVVGTFYIDDILIKASKVAGTSNTVTRESILAEIDGNWQSLGYSQKPVNYMALTYDDGPSPQSSQLLSALAAKNAKATFFLIGSRVNERPELVRTMRDAGHELANHSFSHSSMGSMTLAGAEAEIQGCTDAIYNATNADGKPVRPKFFRAPNLNYGTNLYTACENKYFALIGGHSTADYNGGANANSSQAIADAQINNAKEWQIALCHDPYSGVTANILAAVPLMIDGLRAQGYYFLTLSELLIMRNAGALTPGKVYVDFTLRS